MVEKPEIYATFRLNQAINTKKRELKNVSADAGLNSCDTAYRLVMEKVIERRWQLTCPNYLLNVVMNLTNNLPEFSSWYSDGTFPPA